MQKEPPDSVLCVFCGVETAEYQLVLQIPIDKCPQSFVKSELLDRSGNLKKDRDYLCFEHEELFRIKYLQFKRGHPFCKSFMGTTHSNQPISVHSVTRQMKIDITLSVQLKRWY